MKSVIDKNISKKMQGIAILMMVIHHTFGFPELILPGISYMGISVGSVSIEVLVGQMCKICVALFAFGTGYGLAFKNIQLSYVLNKIYSLLTLYWFSLAVFYIVKLIGGEKISIVNLLLNLCLYKTDINHAAWYLAFYIVAMIVLYILKLLKVRINVVWTIGTCMVCWLFNYEMAQFNYSIWKGFTYFFIYFPVIIIGNYCAINIKMQKLLGFLSESTKGLIASAAVLIITLGLRVVTGSEINGFRLIWIYAPIIYMSLSIILIHLNSFLLLNKILDFLGSYSTESWLFNAVFTCGIFWIQWLGFLPRISVLIIIWEFILMFGLSLLYRKILGLTEKCKIIKEK